MGSSQSAQEDVPEWRRSLRVAIVGGGAAGVVTCRFLLEAGHHPKLLEAGPHLGGIWAPEPTNKVVYRGLVTNIPTVVMQSFDLAFPDRLPSYVKAHELGAYIVKYADHFGLRPFVQLGTRVTSVKPCKVENQEARGDIAWDVACVTGSTKQMEQFDAVVVATGHYDEPYLPEVPGQGDWLAASPAPGARTLIHSREYDDAARFAARTVLVVGGRSSAVDIARELRDTANWIYVLEKGCEQVRSIGRCTHMPLGAEIGPDGLVRLGGEIAPGPPVDDVVLATGFLYHFPFLDSEQLGLDFGAERRYIAPLYQHIVHARRPSLCFIGIPLAVPCPVPLFEAQARFVAAHLRCSMATVSEREVWVLDRRRAVGDRPQDLHFLSNGAWDYMRELTRMAGVEGQDYEAYDRRLTVVQQVYQDRVTKRPQLPWDDDWFRRCEYAVDWDAGTWQVAVPSCGGQAGALQ